MKQKSQTIIYVLLFLITILAGLLRFYEFTKNPPSLNIDEISFGYSAYSILKTGRDETGAFMPLAFKSSGDYKNPVPVYIVVPAIWLFGLNELAVRFPIALIGTLSIPIFFFFIRYLLKNDWFALAGAFLMAISAWHIHFSRFAYDPLLASFFLMLGIWFFIKMLEGRLIWGVLSAIFLVISMYSAFTERLFVPLFVALALALNYKKALGNKKNTIIFLSICVLLVAPLGYLSMFGGANTRLGMIFLTQDIEYTRYVILDHLFKFDETLITFFFWVKRYLSYLQPGFLFFGGLNLTASNLMGLGVLYLFELPLLILGFIKLINSRYSWKKILILWLVLGIFPASLANNETSEGRSLLVLPAVLIVLTLGVMYFVELMKKIKLNFLRWGIYAAIFGLAVINLVQAYLIFIVHFPNQKGEAYMEGSKESVLYAIEHKDEYKEIIYDPFRGIEAPYIVNIPHMYYLFYSKYDPNNYQKENKQVAPEYFHFDKFTVRRVDWVKDSLKQEKTLLIASPWNLPENVVPKEQILKKIYLKNGLLALLVVEVGRDEK